MLDQPDFWKGAVGSPTSTTPMPSWARYPRRSRATSGMARTFSIGALFDADEVSDLRAFLEAAGRRGLLV